jgi:hypothetical protein
MSRTTQRTLVICASAIVIGGLLWKTQKSNGVSQTIGRSLVYFGVNRLLPVFFD